MEEIRPIKTEVGLIYGRDAIYLDSTVFPNSPYTLELKGTLNSTLCSEAPDKKWIGYKITIEAIKRLEVTTLDSYTRKTNSSICQVVNSDWIERTPDCCQDNNIHIIVETYDYVFEVICESADLNIE